MNAKFTIIGKYSIIVDNFKRFKSHDRYRSVVPIEKIAGNYFLHEVSKCVNKLPLELEEEPIEALIQLNNIRERKSEVVNKMRSYLDKLKTIGGANL